MSTATLPKPPIDARPDSGSRPYPSQADGDEWALGAWPEYGKADAGLLVIPMSFKEFLELPEGPKAEWVDGEAIIDMAPAILPHNLVQGELTYELRMAFPHLRPAIETGYLKGQRFRCPDILLVKPQSRDLRWLEDTPVIAVEILSKSTRKIDLVDKAAEYLADGIEQYWTVDPIKQTVVIRGNTGTEWRTLATIDEANPTATITVGKHGTIDLDRAEIFR